MIDVDLRDTNLKENLNAIFGLAKAGVPDTQIQQLYNHQVEMDLKKAEEVANEHS